MLGVMPHKANTSWNKFYWFARKIDDVSDDFTQKMKKLRANIDVLDATLLEL
jgi:hypothetical protein